jgi:hypothetical protein
MIGLEVFGCLPENRGNKPVFLKAKLPSIIPYWRVRAGDHRIWPGNWFVIIFQYLPVRPFWDTGMLS